MIVFDNCPFRFVLVDTLVIFVAYGCRAELGKRAYINNYARSGIIISFAGRLHIRQKCCVTTDKKREVNDNVLCLLKQHGFLLQKN